MPEFLAPGIYVEEVSFRSKSIEGVNTSSAGFVGPTCYGPTNLPPHVITSLAEFEQAYGGGRQLVFGSAPVENYIWHAARAFFQEGGQRLYISRVFRPWPDDEDPGSDAANNPLHRDGIATAVVDPAGMVRVSARFPGAAGNMRVRFTLRVGRNALTSGPGPDGARRPIVSGLLHRDVVLLNGAASPLSGSAFALAVHEDAAQEWSFHLQDGTSIPLSSFNPAPDPAASGSVRPVTLTIAVLPQEPTATPLVFEGLALDPAHTRDAAPDSAADRFPARPACPADARTLPIVLHIGEGADGLQVLDALFDANDGLRGQVLTEGSTDVQRSVEVLLTGGNDGKRPGAQDCAGREFASEHRKTGLAAFEDIDDISIVAAPGSTEGCEDGSLRQEAAGTVSALVAHVGKMRYRISVLDSGKGQSISQVRAMRSTIDSSRAALYYPWIKVSDPFTPRQILLPPSGFVAGIYARTDAQRGVYKAPANEAITLAIGLERVLNKSQQDVLNQEGINCFRYFEGRGCLLWGARTASGDPEWKYVNLRRYFDYLEHSVDQGTGWAVFEPNGETLWSNVRRTVEDFLFNQWQAGALLGDKPEKAYFVRCDRSTMTQNDLDNGRLVCLIGVAVLRPAEFVIFRIGQWTADRKD